MLQKPNPIIKRRSMNIDEQQPIVTIKLPKTIHKSKTTEYTAQEVINISNSSTHEDLAMVEIKRPVPTLFQAIDVNFLLHERKANQQSLSFPPTKRVIIFDLDETLIYNTAREFPGQPPIIFPRPYYYEMFSKLTEYYDIWIWSASERHYIDAILKNMDPNRIFVKKILSRDDCTLSKEGFLVKDMGRFINLDLSRVVMVDNAAISYITCMDNGILVTSFNGSSNDMELMGLTGMLLGAKFEGDLRNVVMKYRAYCN